MRRLWQTILTLSATALLVSAFAASASAQPRTAPTAPSATSSCADGLCISEQDWSDCEAYQARARDYDECRADLAATETERDQEQGRAMELREQLSAFRAERDSLRLDLHDTTQALDDAPGWGWVLGGTGAGIIVGGVMVLLLGL